MYDIEAIREDFPVLKDWVYLDNAATSQTPVPAVEAMCEYFYEYAANHGRGSHRLAIETTNRCEDSRDNIAAFFNSDPLNTVFTKNTTEGLNIIANGLSWNEDDHIITTAVEHHSNIVPWIRLAKSGLDITIIEPNREGIVDPMDVEAAIKDNTRLISVTHSSNSFGSIQDIDSIIKIAEKNDCLSVIDGAQSAGHMEIDFKGLDCDFFATAGHKGLLGPQGTGLLLMKDPELLEPSYIGGGTTSDTDISIPDYTLEDWPERFEAGTPNIPGIIGLGKAVDYVKELGLKNIQAHEEKLGHETAKRISEIEGVEVYGPENGRSGVVPFNVEGMEPANVAMLLDHMAKVCVRSGKHCATPGLHFLGIPGSVRASFGAYNTEEEANLLVELIEEICQMV